MPKIQEIVHPSYDINLSTWEQYRLVGTGGEAFLEKYLIKRVNEKQQTYTKRKQLTYIPAFAKSALNQVLNSIRQRLTAVVRSGGSDKYQRAVKGLSTKGVDRKRSSMNKFISENVLRELAMMGSVGVYVDAPVKEENSTLLDDKENSPYLYIYKVEDIRAWALDPKDPTRFVKLLLREFVEVSDPDYGLSTDVKERYRYYSLDESSNLTVQFFDENGNEVEPFEGAGSGPIQLDLDFIPFVRLELSSSLLADIARYQVTLLNIGSSDTHFCWAGNTVFLAEQYNEDDPTEFASHFSSNEDEGGEEAIKENKDKVQRFVGTDKGIRVPKGVNYPEYIAPPSGPLEVSIKKSQQLKEEIQELLNQTLKNLSSRSASTEVNRADTQREEDGLKAIGDELEFGENMIALYWSKYEDTGKSAEVVYPDNYSFKTDEDKRTEAKDYSGLMLLTPSLTAKKEIAKKIVEVLLSGSITDEVLIKCFKEIDASPAALADPDVLTALVEANIVSPETASTLIGFDSTEAGKAEAAHVRRAQRIAEAQSKANENAGARGVNDLAVNPSESAKAEKQAIKIGKQSG